MLGVYHQRCHNLITYYESGKNGRINFLYGFLALNFQGWVICCKNPGLSQPFIVFLLLLNWNLPVI